MKIVLTNEEFENIKKLSVEVTKDQALCSKQLSMNDDDYINIDYTSKTYRDENGDFIISYDEEGVNIMLATMAEHSSLFIQLAKLTKSLVDVVKPLYDSFHSAVSDKLKLYDTKKRKEFEDNITIKNIEMDDCLDCNKRHDE